MLVVTCAKGLIIPAAACKNSSFRYSICMIPQDLHALFWNVDLETFDPIQYPEYTIFRVLELGDRPAITWLRKTFSQDQIKEVIRNEQRLSPRSANFWALIYGIPLEEIAALREPHRVR